jgi:hypothetical protein
MPCPVCSGSLRRSTSLFSLFMMFTASFRADMPAFSMRWFRMMALAFLLLDVFGGVISGDWKGVEIWVFVLFAEYAATITNIPPADSRETSRSLRQSDARN